LQSISFFALIYGFAVPLNSVNSFQIFVKLRNGEAYFTSVCRTDEAFMDKLRTNGSDPVVAAVHELCDLLSLAGQAVTLHHGAHKLQLFFACSVMAHLEKAFIKLVNKIIMSCTGCLLRYDLRFFVGIFPDLLTILL